MGEEKTLEDFGYEFTAEGKLLDKEGEPFKFDVYETKDENQKRYEAIGELCTEHIYMMLEQNVGLERVYVPKEIQNENRSFIFASPKILSANKICVFLNGAGVVRAGQWARRVIMNDSIDEGSMLPYIAKVQSLGYSVVCMNTNQKGFMSPSPTIHARLVWKEFISESSATKIVIIAHSMGGAESIELAPMYKDDFMNRVKGIFLTDSVHTSLTTDDELNNHLAAIGKNYVTSKLPAGESTQRSFRFGNDFMPRFSSGHNEHIWTSHAAKECIFKDLDELEEEEQEQKEEIED